MKTFLAYLKVGAVVLLLSPLAALSEPTNPCALLQPGDLASLLGGTPNATSKGPVCIWEISGNPKNLKVVMSPQTGMTAEMNFGNAQKGASKNPSYTEEKELGARAFSLAGKGVVAIIALKNGNLFEFKYKTGDDDGGKGLEALRPVVKKALTPF